MKPTPAQRPVQKLEPWLPPIREQPDGSFLCEHCSETLTSDELRASMDLMWKHTTGECNG